MEDIFFESIITGNYNPPSGSLIFTSSDHIRFQNGVDVSGHNHGANRRFIIERNIDGNDGYSVTMYNLDGNHPFWQNNIQMATKQMRIESVSDNIIQMRGYGVNQLGASFADYGIVLLIEEKTIKRIQLNLYDRNISIVYLK